MAVRSRRFAGPTAVAAGATVSLFTVAAGRTAVVHSLHVYCATAGRLFVNIGAATLAVEDFLANKDGNLVDGGWWCMNPGDEIKVISSGGFVGNATMMGAYLLGAPA